MGRISKANKLLILLFAILSCTFRVGATSSHQSPPHKIHVVEAQETVYSISRRNGVSEEDIYKLNPGSELGIRIGQELRIPIKKSVQQPQFPPSTKEGFHVVQQGETLYSIAKRYGITVAILLQYNPDISAESLQPGTELRVALSNGSNNPNANNKIIVVSPEGLNKVDVALLLPVGNNGPARYIQFYEGFLLGLYQLKRNGISVTLNVHQVQNEGDLQTLLSDKKLQSANLIIGGHTERTVNLLSKYSELEGIPYISPFIAQSKKSASSRSIFRINTPQQELYPFVAQGFTSRYNNENILFIEEEQGNHKAVVTALKKQIKNTGRKFQTCSHRDFISGNATSVLSNNTVLIPNQGGQKQLKELLSALKRYYSTVRDVTIFGYPEWQSYGKETLSDLGEYRGTIYSSFFFDRTMKESAGFLKNYQLWFNRKNTDGFPRYNVLGYDIARYFIRASAIYGASFSDSFSQLPSDGLQMNFIFKRLNNEEHYTSGGLFFVTFDASGKPHRQDVGY